MKQWTAVILLLSLLLLSSCRRSLVEVDPPDMPPVYSDSETKLDVDLTLEGLGELAKNLALQMVSGDFLLVSSLFSENLKNKSSGASLKDKWESFTLDLGYYVGFHTMSVSQIEDYTAAKIYLDYVYKDLALSLRFNEAGELDGIWLSYYEIPAPKETDLYKEFLVTIGEGQFKMDGILTLPKGVNRPPVAIFVHGSGQSDMDETVGVEQNKPFSDLAHGLAEQGIASIRYHKRYYQYQELAGEDITVREEVLQDVADAIRFASSSEKVDGSRIYIIGHSFGGMLCPVIAYENKEVKGFVSLAGSPRPLEDIVYDQYVAAAYQNKAMTESRRQTYLYNLGREVEKIKNAADTTEEQYFGVSARYWHVLNQLDGGTLATWLDIPMLFLQGTADYQVSVENDYNRWRELLADKPAAAFRLYDNLNHYFLESDGLSDAADYNAKRSVSPQVISDIADFLRAAAENK